MSQGVEKGGSVPPSKVLAAAKKPYRKPEFSFERVFETRALACGKVSYTQGQCRHNLQSS
ncbi:MAG: hypothetical protein WCB53_19235 [Terriglobales bacterium]